MKYFNYLFAEKSVQIAKTMLFSLFLALLPGNPLAAQCMLTCNSGLVVEVPSGGSYELLPDILGEGGLAQTCPGGVFQTQILENGDYLPAIGNVIFDDSDVGQTFVARLRDDVSGNACWGDVQVIGEMLQNDTVRFQLCAELTNGRLLKGAKLTFLQHNPAFPIPPMVFTLDSSQACAEVTIVLSDFLPDATFSYIAEIPDTGHVNGVNVVDLCLMAQHILGVNPLPSPYAMVAADANKSGSITTFDMVEFRKLMMGIYTTLPNNTSWRYAPDYCLEPIPNPNNPVGGGCASNISLSELAALNGDTAKVFVIKVGDVDGDVQINGEPYNSPIVVDSLTLLLPQGQIMAGVPVTIPVKLDKGLLLGSLQAQFFLDPNLVQFDSISEGALGGFFSGMTYYDAQTGRLKLVASGYSNYFIPAGTPLLYIHLTPLQTVDLTSAVMVVQDDPNLRTFAIGNDCVEYFEIGSAYSGFVSTHTPERGGLRVLAPSPNPFGEQTVLEIELENPETAFLEVIDLDGRILFSASKNLAAGISRWEIPGSAMPAGSFAIWRLRVAGQMAAGTLMRIP